MKGILIVLFLTVLLGAGGFMLTAEIARQRQNSAAEKLDRPDTGNLDKDMTESMRRLNRATGDLSKRQTYAMIGGGVGAGIGLLCGIFLASRLDRKRSA